jgi:predicted flap endonuclease-1-like 5' DNA nuclease
MLALFLQTMLLMAAAYFVGAAVACAIRRSLHADAEPVPVRAERRVEPLPELRERRGQAAELRRAAGSEVPPASITVPAAKPEPPSMTVPAGMTPPISVTVPAADLAHGQDLKRVRRIDGEVEAGLNRLGVRRYEHIAAWLRPDVDRIGKALGLEGRISRENWIEQAQVLAKGGETHYAMRLARGEAARAGPTPDEGEPRRLAAAAVTPRASTGGAAGVAVEVAVPAAAAAPKAPAAEAAPPAVSERAAFAAERSDASALEPAVPLRPVPPPARDNLQRIGGIDAEAEKLLAAHGVGRYSQIAHWSPADVARLEAQLGSTGRIGRENWIEQAQILSRGGDTAYSRDYDRRARGEGGAAASRPTKLADAIRENSVRGGGEAPRAARSDLGALRSVRSEAYQSSELSSLPTQRGGYQGKVGRSAQLDDLKRIRGIGVLIEKRLNSLGVVAYEQIANWTAEEIDRVSQSLDFKGRIERENWVEQARILASGGATEFSRRVDRGEVETSRYRP